MPSSPARTHEIIVRHPLPLTLALLLGVALLLSGCPAGDDDDASADDDVTGDDDSADDDDTTGDDDDAFPPDPAPFTLSLGGGITESIPFDSSECLIYPPGVDVNFRTTWRGASHNAVLIAEVLGGYAGAGSYPVGDGVRVKLQTEAGSTYNFAFSVDVAQGDSGTIDVLGADLDAGQLWGDITFSGMHGADGAITVQPQPVPLWCDVIDN